MNILDKIIAHKKIEVAQAKEKTSVGTLEQSEQFMRQPFSLSEFLRHDDKTGIIAEIKRQSPSKGIINADICVEKISTGYVAAGASALSILTDNTFFGGSNADLQVARTANFCPILRKDFMIDEYQVLEAKSLGADVILLIAAVLPQTDIKRLGALAQSLGMEVLLEVHNENELLESLSDEVNLVGVNNRNLKTFVTDIATSYALADKIPDEFLKVSESGINNPSTIKDLKRVGFEGFLIGETFMQAEQPNVAAEAFMRELR